MPMIFIECFQQCSRKDAETDGSDILKDLLDGKSDDKDYYAYFENWVFSAGYPLLIVMLDEVENTTSIAKLTQVRQYKEIFTALSKFYPYYLRLTYILLFLR